MRIILALIIFIELILIMYLYGEKNYWKYVCKNQKKIIKKWWYEEGDKK